MKRIRNLTVGGLITTMVLMIAFTSGAFGAANPSVLSPAARVQGLTLGQWHAEMWRVSLAIPASQDLGPYCYLGQIGNVGIGVSYSEIGSSECEMPVGMILYVLVIGSECSTGEPPPFYGGNEAELKACATSFISSNLQASVDGIPVQNIEKYAALSPLYQFTLPADNIVGIPAGTYDSVAYNTGFLLAPLSPGEHVVHVHSELPSYEWVYDWTYYITVK
jgi:hypothetical protein